MHSINAVLGLSSRHMDPVPNGRLHVDLHSRGLSLLRVCEVHESTKCPICHFRFQKGAHEDIRDRSLVNEYNRIWAVSLQLTTNRCLQI